MYLLCLNSYHLYIFFQSDYHQFGRLNTKQHYA